MSDVEEINYPTVEEWLDRAVFGDELGYVPSKFALGFLAFIKLVNGGEGEENKTPVLHLRMLDTIANAKGNDVRIANMVFRGAAKTTVLGEYLFLYIAVFGELRVLARSTWRCMCRTVSTTA